MDMRRFLPIMLILFAALFILPQLFKGSSSGGALSAKERGALTRDAIERIDRGEQKVFADTGSYTAHVADIVALDKVLAAELTVPLTVDLDVTASGKRYLARVSSDVISVVRARSGDKIVIRGCRALKSRGAKCPEAAPKKK